MALKPFQPWGAAGSGPAPTIITQPGGPAVVYGASPVWHIRISERDGDATALGYLGEAVPTPEGGGGGYENVAMPKQGGVTVWRGKPDLTYSFEIIFSKFITDESVMDDVTTLWRMYSPADSTTPPPVVKFNASGTLAPFEAVDWWIDSLEWGDAEANQYGERTLQRMTVHLTEYRADAQIVRTTRHQWPAMVIVKKGWTLKTIASRYKVPGGWRAIGKIQNPPINDPRKVKTGQHIRMP
jgi:hypothetical protein